MAKRTQGRENPITGTRRASISLPAELHQELEQIAKQKKVSLAWVIRDAAETYIKEKYPLFASKD